MSEDDKTILRPRPGGRRPRPGGARRPPSAPRQPVESVEDLVPRRAGAAGPVVGSGRSPLLAAAAPLLALVPALRGSAQAADTRALRRHLLSEIRSFEAAARHAGASSAQVENCRYILCTTLDEMVLNTPWGSRSEWSNQTLLAELHHETAGGKRVFHLLKEFLKAPAEYVDELELVNYCLALGFQGQYRVVADGRERLASIRDRLADTLRAQRGPLERDLSANWQGVSGTENPVIRNLPAWAAAALALLILTGVYVGLLFNLNSRSDPVLEQLLALPQAVAAAPARPGATPPVAPETQELRRLLAPQIEQGLLDVREDAYQALLTLRGDTVNLFRSGSATIDPVHFDLLARVGSALQRVPGAITVVGHTDSVPIRTIRYPSNWHLSKARAAEVARAIEHMLGEGRTINSDGRGHAQPLVPNDSRLNRARNRRVEIQVVK